MSDILIDASYLVALGYPSDRSHEHAKAFAAENPTGLLIPDVVLTEAIFNLRRLGGTAATVRFSQLLAEQSPHLLVLTITDFVRAVALMDRYRDAELDFVDSCLTALAERLDITQICTF